MFESYRFPTLRVGATPANGSEPETGVTEAELVDLGALALTVRLLRTARARYRGAAIAL